MKKLKLSNWQEHPWSKTGMVEKVSTQFLKEISNPEAKPFTDDLANNPQETLARI